MALRNIRELGDPVLNKKCKEVKEVTERTKDLIEDMFETMYEAEGVGLAAPQVGILKRICVIDCGDDPILLINRKVLETSGEQTGQEGCLSVPGIYGIVRRPMKVTVRAQDRSGKSFELSGEGLLARAMCHEIAHLDGGIFTDVMDRLVEQEEQE